MNRLEKNELVAASFNELVFRARRVGTTITRQDLSDYLLIDGSFVSHWLNGKRQFDDEKIEKTLKFIASYDSLVSKKEMVSKLRDLANYLETI